MADERKTSDDIKQEIVELESKSRQMDFKTREINCLLMESRLENSRIAIRIDEMTAVIGDKKLNISELEDDIKEAQELCLNCYKDFKRFQCQKTIDEANIQKAKDKKWEVQNLLNDLDFAIEEINCGVQPSTQMLGASK